MKPFSIAMLCSAVVVGVGVYMYASGSAASADIAAPTTKQPDAIMGAPLATVAFAPPPSAQSGMPPTNPLRWTTDVASPDAHRRAEAIGALAGAPAAVALPILKTVLSSGEPVVDRPLALRSLRDIAVRDGDADGVIRDMMRRAIHQADNQMFSHQAQAVLDDLEVLLAAR